MFLNFKTLYLLKSNDSVYPSGSLYGRIDEEQYDPYVADLDKLFDELGYGTHSFFDTRIVDEEDNELTIAIKPAEIEYSARAWTGALERLGHAYNLACDYGMAFIADDTEFTTTSITVQYSQTKDYYTIIVPDPRTTLLGCYTVRVEESYDW